MGVEITQKNQVAHVGKNRMRKTHPFFTKTIGISFFLCVFGLIFSLSVILNVMNLNFYKKQYQNLNLNSELKISEEDYLNATKDLLMYTNGKRADISVKATIDGEYRSVFNEREITHMHDVKDLYSGLKKATVFFLATMFVLMLVMYLLDKKYSYSIFLASYRKAVLILGVFILIIMITIFTDFSKFWTMFHQLFFKNDLWLLDPNTDFMILMFPEPLFYALVVRILGWFSLGIILLGLFIKISKKKFFEIS